MYRYPKKIITLNRRNSSEEKKPLNIKAKITKYLTENKAFAESFIFIGTNGRFHSLIHSIIEKECYHADYQVYDLQITHTGTCISRVKGRDKSSPALIIKIPVNDFARFRLRNNFRNMEELRTRFPIIRGTTPIPITFGCFNNQDYWVESYIQGLSGETIGRERKQQIIFNSFNKLMDIHIDSRISASIEKINDKIEKTYCAFQGSDILWDASEKSIIAKAFTFLKHNIPEQTFFVLGHNDYHLGNILFDSPSMNVAGILDWDLASKYEFALLDALHLIVRSNKADNTIITSLEKNIISPSAADNKLLAHYMKILSIPSKDFTFYLMIYLFELLKKDLSAWQMGLGGVEKLYFSMTIEEIHNLIKLMRTIL
ncbi:MAG TPA: hypothetical protein ENO00_12060 [Deltaproteobacteria bacterium]|nr:hypothetical protein [Deltaproteobacteria bacterium]